MKYAGIFSILSVVLLLNLNAAFAIDCLKNGNDCWEDCLSNQDCAQKNAPFCVSCMKECCERTGCSKDPKCTAAIAPILKYPSSR